MVICLERGADLHMAQLMPLPLTVSCISEIQIGLTFLVMAHRCSPGQKTVKRVCECMCVHVLLWPKTAGLMSLCFFVCLSHWAYTESESPGGSTGVDSACLGPAV